MPGIRFRVELGSPRARRVQTPCHVVTFAFVTFRLCDELMGAHKILDNDESAKLLAWGCWAIPLLATEVVLQAGAIFRGAPSPPRALA